MKTGTGKLTENEARLRLAQIVESSNDAILSTTLDGVVESWNAAAEKLFGYTRDEAIGQSILTLFVPPEHADEVIRKLKANAQGQHMGPVDTVRRRKDGALVDVSVMGSPIVDDTGKVVGVSIDFRDITDRKRVIEALRESQARLDLALRSAHMGVWSFDLVANKRHYDNQTCRLLGIDPATFTGAAEEFFRVVHPDDLEMLKAALARSIEQHIPYDLDYRIVRPDGSIRYISSRARVERGEGGQPLRFIGVLWDITNRRQQEVQAQQLLAEKETILGNALVGIVYLKQRRIVSCNRRFEEMFQYEPGELIGKSTELLYDSRETFEYIGEVAYKVTPENKGYNGDVRLRHKDGSLFWGTLSGKPIDPVQSHEGSIWIYSDITDRKEAEADLRIAATAFDSQESLMITDANGVILRVNQAFTKSTGYTAEEAVGQTPRLLKSGRHDEAFYRKLWERIRRKGTWQGEVWDRHKNGRVYPRLLTISAVTGDNGAVTHYVGSHIDLTERKIIEKKLERHTQLYAALSQCNKAIVYCSSEEALFQQVCHAAVQFGGLKMAWVGLIDPESHTVQPAASFGDGTDYLGSIELSVDPDNSYGGGPTCIAIRENRPYWCQNLRNDPATIPWRDSLVRAGWTSLASLPLQKGGVVVGALILYSSEINAFDELARNLLVEMATTISFALDAFDHESQRKQIEQALLDEKTFSDTLIRGLPDVFYLIDRQGGLLRWNSKLAELVGLSPEEMSVANSLAFIHEEDRPFIAQKLQDAFEIGVAEAEARLILKNGVRHYVLTATRVETQHGINVVGVGVDITERKRAGEALRDSQARLDLALRSGNMGVWQLDIVADKRHFDNQQCFLLGINPDTFKGSEEEFFRVIHPDDREAVRVKLARTIEQDVPYESEFRAVWPDGSIHYIATRGRLVRDDQDRPLRINGVIFEITEWKEAQNRIHNLAFYDSLTSLPNRRLLSDRLQQALVSSARNGLVGAILFIDLDNFKTINDTLGHALGDALLQQVATRLTSCVREEDTVSRIGGDEFVVMLENLSADESAAATHTKSISEKILTSLSQPYQVASNEYRSTCSIGITLFNDRQQQTDELLKQADIAMYQAKKAGRNTLRFFDPQMQDTVIARVALEGELRRALETQQFQLYYQIQVDSLLKSIGAEALIRWNHPDRGLVLPGQFITLAEETGLILPIGQWILEAACAQLKVWEQEEHTRELVLAVNVSAREFRQADFVAQVQATVQRHAIHPMRLKLELTESLLLENIEDTIAIMNALNEIGIQFSLDDFGTGYSSLQYLKRLPLDQIKIDQSFVRDLAVDSSDEAIVRTIIAMARNLNLDVIAEGVETEEQLQMLLNMGCTHYQGYLFGKPVSIEQFEALVKQS